MIEDINYLYENSKKENIIILVDSSRRNKRVYPDVAEFQVPFPQPFMFVFGIDILHTTIPRTQFMIEDYNNSLASATGFDMLAQGFSYTNTYLMSQDFSSASSFFQRMNDQLGDLFTVDNYDNVTFDEKYTLRSVSDYPIPRFSTERAPFLINASLSTSRALLGFNQIPLGYNNVRYNSVNEVLNTYCPVIKRSPENTRPYEFVDSHNVAVVRQSDTFATFSFDYRHRSSLQCGSFLQTLVFEANTNFINFSSQPFVRVSVYKLSADRETQQPFVEEFMHFFGSDQSNLLEITSFTNDTNALRYGGVNKTHNVLEYNGVYRITISNVLALNTFKVTRVSVGSAYFYEIDHINIRDDIFLSRSIYDEQNVEMTTVANGFNPPSSDRTYCSKTNPVAFNLKITEQLVADFFSNTRSILYEFNVFIDTYEEPPTTDDTFVLRLDRESNGVSERVCELLMTPTTDINGSAILSYRMEDVQNAFFAYVHMKMGETFDNLYSYTCTLFASKPIYVLGTNTEVKHIFKCMYLESFGIGSPGMINLAFENFLIMRCPEIETHIRGSYNVNEDNETGMGVANIDVSGYATNRNEFFSVDYKEFHPIGKLDKLTFRFERKSDKKLYDFKNIDLHFLMSIKYLRPFNKFAFTQSSLNPNYDPNYLGYFPKNMQNVEEDSDSSDDEASANRKYINIETKLSKQLNKHNMIDE